MADEYVKGDPFKGPRTGEPYKSSERLSIFKRFWIQYEEPERGEPSMLPVSSYEVAQILRDCGWTVEAPNYNREPEEVKTG